MTDQQHHEELAQSERRLGLLILEQKTGAALAAGVPHFRAAAEGFEKAGWPTRRAECLMDLGRLHAKAGNHADAGQVFGDALRVFEAARDAKNAGEAAGLAGAAWVEQSDFDQALRLLKRAVELAEERNDHVQIALCLVDLARCLIARREAEPALAALTRALAIFTAFKKGIQRALVHELMGAAHAIADRPQQAGENYETSAAISQELGRGFEAGETLARYADMQRDRGDHVAAIALHERCLTLHHQAGNAMLEAQTLRRVGMVEVKRGQLDQAIERYQRALDLCRSVDDHDGVSRTLYLIGAANARAGRAGPARAAFEQSLAAAEAHNNPAHMEQALSALANLHRSLGEPEQALAIMQRWVEILKVLGDRSDQLKVLGTMAEIQQERGALGEAEAHLRRLISVCTRPEDRSERIRAQHSLGVLLAKRGQFHEAIEFLGSALTGLGDRQPDDRAKLRYQIGSCHLALREGEAALTQFETALKDLDLEPEEKIHAKVLVGIGNAHGLLGRRDSAKQFFDQAAALCEKQGDVRATTIIRKATRDLG